MTHFYFDIINGTGLTRDEEGQDLSDLPAARIVALEGVRSILRDEVTEGFVDLGGRVEIFDADRQRLVSIPFGDAVELRGVGAPQSLS